MPHISVEERRVTPSPLRTDRVRKPSGLAIVLILLFVTGWAANHFASMIPVLAHAEGLSASVLQGAFGVYALGLLPGLLGGGGFSDRVGRRPVILSGAAVAAAGNLLMLLWHSEAGIYSGRLVVGIGVGLAVSAGTAWAADLGGKKGTATSGAILTAGFALGPLASGLIAQFLPQQAALVVPFAVTALLSAGAVCLALLIPNGPARPDAPTPTPIPDRKPTSLPTGSGQHSLTAALTASVPMALWVFSTVAVEIVVLAGRMEAQYSGPWLPGMASAVSLGTGVLVQFIARRADWGAYSGVTGTVLATVGFCLAAATGSTPTLPMFLLCAVLLGCAYGLCLREGLVDVEILAPPQTRGVIIGVFYVCAYLGFGLPVLLEAIRPAVGTVTPMLVLAALALLAATIRTVHIRTTGHLTR